KNYSIATKLYIVISIMILFGEGIFLRELIMPFAALLLCIAIYNYYFSRSKTFIYKIKFNNPSVVLMCVIVLLFTYQMSMSFRPSTTLVFIERFIVYTGLLIY